MKTPPTWAKLIFYLRNPRWLHAWRLVRWRIMGMQINSPAVLGRIYASWPHQVEIGAHARIGDHVSFNFDGAYQSGPTIFIGEHVFVGMGVEFNVRQKFTVGDGTLIAAGSRFIDHDHGMAANTPMRNQAGPEASIHVGRDCWISANVVVLKGVSIGDGAVIAAGSIVTKPVPPMEIWAGVPARKIGSRAASA